LKGTEYGRSENTVWIRILRLLYIAIKVYINFAYLPGGIKSLPPGGRWHAKRDGRSSRYFGISNVLL